MLTSRERMRRCFFGEELDRPGVYCRTGFPPNDSSYDPLRRLFNEQTDLKSGWPAHGCVESPALAESQEPYSDDFARLARRLKTPAGDLVSTSFVGLKNQPGMVEKHFITTPADAKRYLSLPGNAIGGDVTGFFEMDRQIGDRGIVVADLGLNPAGAIAHLCGSDSFAMMSVTDRQLLHELCHREMEQQLRLVDFLLARGVGPFFASLGQEYVVPPLHGPKDFADFNVRYDKPIYDRIHDADGKVHVHCHGPIKTVLDGFLEVGADVLHPFEPPPMGDIEPAEAKRMVRGRMCLEGNIQIADMYEKTPDEIRRQTEELIAAAFDDNRGLIVCPTASPYIPGAGPQCFEQFGAMIETVTNWKQPTTAP